LPACFTPEGCPIKDLATDRALNLLIEQWITARNIRTATDDPSFARPILEAAGLVDDAELLIQMERIYQEWVNTKQKQEAEKQRSHSRSRKR
jgi:hypothetical protein